MTKERPTSQEMDFSDLIETTIQIMTLRGGPTSGNWAHGGRKGKRGGSGKGGGFKRIGVKGGKKGAKKLGRKGIKRSSRQARVKDERGKGGGLPKKTQNKQRAISANDIIDQAKKIQSSDKSGETKFAGGLRQITDKLSAKETEDFLLTSAQGDEKKTKRMKKKIAMAKDENFKSSNLNSLRNMVYNITLNKELKK